MFFMLYNTFAANSNGMEIHRLHASQTLADEPESRTRTSDQRGKGLLVVRPAVERFKSSPWHIFSNVNDHRCSPEASATNTER
jgi:hypothetical protein